MSTGQFQAAVQGFIEAPVPSSSLKPVESPLEAPEVQQLASLREAATSKVSSILLLLKAHDDDENNG